MPPENQPNPDHARDLRLVRAALSGSEPDRKELARRLDCIPRFCQHLNRELGKPLDEHGLCDLIQDVLEIIWRKLSLFKGRATLETWAFRISNLELLNATRKRTRQNSRKVELAQDDDGNASFDRFTAPRLEEPTHLRFESLYLGISQLSADDQALLRRKHFGGLSFEEIAIEMDLTPSGVKHRYYSALRQLRDSILSQK